MTIAGACALRLKASPSVVASIAARSAPGAPPPEARIGEGWYKSKLAIPQVHCMGIGKELSIGSDPLGPSRQRVQATIVAKTMTECDALAIDVLKCIVGSWVHEGIPYYVSSHGKIPQYGEDLCSIVIDFDVSRFADSL